MNITNVQITMLRNQKRKRGKLEIAYASITLDDSMVVNSIKVLKRDDDQYEIQMPSHPIGKTSRRDTCFPITNHFRKEIEKQIVTKLDTYF